MLHEHIPLTYPRTAVDRRQQACVVFDADSQPGCIRVCYHSVLICVAHAATREQLPSTGMRAPKASAGQQSWRECNSHTSPVQNPVHGVEHGVDDEPEQHQAHYKSPWSDGRLGRQLTHLLKDTPHRVHSTHVWHGVHTTQLTPYTESISTHTSAVFVLQQCERM